MSFKNNLVLTCMECETPIENHTVEQIKKCLTSMSRFSRYLYEDSEDVSWDDHVIITQYYDEDFDGKRIAIQIDLGSWSVILKHGQFIHLKNAINSASEKLSEDLTF